MLGLDSALTTQAVLELIHRDCLVGGHAVVLCLFVNDFVHRLDLVGDLGHNVFLLDHRLDSLVEVVVDRLCNGGGLGGLGLLSFLLGCVLEGGLLGSDLGLDLITLLVLVDLAFLGGLNLSGVLLSLNLLILEWLDCGVVVVLVTFAVDDLLFSSLVLVLDVLMLNCWGDSLVDGGVLLACSSRVNDWSYLRLGLGLRGLDILGLDLRSVDLLGLGVEFLTCAGAEWC